MTKELQFIVHRRTNVRYMILHEGKMKVNDKWIASVTYESTEDGQVYTRPFVEVVDKFKFIL